MDEHPEVAWRVSPPSRPARRAGLPGIWAHAPRAVPAAVVLNALFETGNWALEPALRKLVHLRVARIIGCVF